MKKRIFSWVLAFALLLGCLPEMAIVEAEEEVKPTKVVVSVEGQTLGQGFYIEPEIVTFDEFIDYWAQKGQTVTPDAVTAGGVLSYALQKNGTPMDYQESVSGPAYLATVKGVDKGYTDLPQFLKDAGVVLEEYDGDQDLSEHKYTSGSGWMYTEGNIMSDQAMGGHWFYTFGSPYEQNGESYYVVRLQYTVDGLGADLGFDRSGVSYSYAAADKGQLYILYANLAESGFFVQNPQAQADALAVMNTLNATQDAVDAAYATLLEACHAELPVLNINLSEEPVYYGVGEAADALEVQAAVTVGELSYEWFSSTDKMAWTSLGVGEASYTPSTETSGTIYYKCVVTNYDKATGLSNEVTSNIATVVTGIETPVFVEDLDSKEVTYLTVDTAKKLRVGAQIAGEGTISYQWYQSADKASWEKVDGATEQEYVPKTEKIGTTYYKCIVTNTLNGQSTSADSTVATVTVKVDTPVFEENLRTTTYNPKFDEEFKLSVKASVKDEGSVSYQWYEGETLAKDGSVEGMTLIPEATSETYQIDTSKKGAKYYKVVATNTLKGETVSTVSKWSRIELKAETPRFTKNLGRDDIYYLVGEKNPEPLEVEAVTENGGEITYQWYQSETDPWGSISNMKAIEGATQPILTVDTAKGHTTYYACQATNTLRGDVQTADSRSVKVVVSCEKPTITKDLAEKTSYPVGETAEPLEVVATVSDGGTLSYQWYNSNGMIEGATKSSYVPDTTIAGKMEYWVTVTNTKLGITNSTDSKHASIFVKAKQKEIATEEELRAMQPNGNYILTADIELTSNWEPIQKFAGILDGNGHTISNVVINKKVNGPIGFFSDAGNGAVIKNIGLVGTITQSGNGQAGGLVGQTFGDGLTISNCYVKADVKAPEWYHVGGLVGQMGHQGTIENSYFIGTLAGGSTEYSFAGGLIGQTYNNGVVIRNSYTTCDKAIGDYAKYDSINSQNNYCGSAEDAHAAQIPENMADFLIALNGAEGRYAADENQINDGYPILLWQKTEKAEEPAPEPAEAYWGVQTEAKVYEDFENDLWLQYQQKEMKVGDTASLRPWRLEQIISNAITNDVQRPTFRFEIIAGDSISLDTDSSNDKAVVTAKKPGTSVVKVTYDAFEYGEKTWGAVSPVNTAYAVFTVGETGTATITCSEELQNWRHYDTIYYTEGETVPYTFNVSSEDAASIKVTLNGEEIEGTDGKYTANLENRSNIIGILAKDKDGKLKSFYRVVDARFIEVKVENKTTPGETLRPGDTANISFRGVTMPVYKMATIYNPVWTSDGAWGKSDAAYLSYKNEILGAFKGQCKQWDLSTNNDFDVTFAEAGAYTFDGSEGIWCEWWGQPLGTDLTAKGSGEPGLGVPALNGWFSKLPSFTVTVEEEPEKIPVGTVNVSVQDMIPTPEGKDWPEARGVMLESAQISIYEDDTMLDAIERACVENNLEIEIDSVYSYIKEIGGLGEMDRGEKSGWFGTLNGWMPDKSMKEFSVANGGLADGDQITMEYSTNWGNDLTDTTDVTGELKSLGNDTGELAPQYSRDVYEYTLTIPKDTTEVSFRPESFNRNNIVTIQSNEKTYRPGAMIPVEEGTLVNITSIPVSYTTPVEPDTKAVYQVIVKYEEDSQNPGEPGEPEEPEEPEKTPLTIMDSKYGLTLTGEALTEDMQLVVSKLTKEDAAVDAIRKAIPSNKGVFGLYHVELWQNGKEIELPDAAELKIPVGEKYNEKKMDVLLHHNGEVEKLSGSVSEEYISVKVAKLGDFGVVTDMPGNPSETNGTTARTVGNGTAKTGDSTQMDSLVYLLVVCAVVITAVVVIKKKRQGK